MTTKKVDDLTTDELNEQVAICNGWKKAVDVCCDNSQIWITNDGVWLDNYDPCHNAKQAFVIIDSEKISINYEYNLVVATKANQVHSLSTASTALISAMRCFVKSVKGETVEL